MSFMEAKILNNEWNDLNLKNLLLGKISFYWEKFHFIGKNFILFFPPYGYDLCSEKSVTNLDCDQPRLGDNQPVSIGLAISLCWNCSGTQSPQRDRRLEGGHATVASG